MNRLFYRLITFRDEHIDYKALPMMQGIADRVNMHGLNRNFNIIQELHKDNLGTPFTAIQLYGTIFTRYDREVAQILQEKNEFKDLVKQDEFVAKKMSEKMDQFKEIGKKMGVINFNEFPIEVTVRITL